MKVVWILRRKLGVSRQYQYQLFKAELALGCTGDLGASLQLSVSRETSDPSPGCFWSFHWAAKMSLKNLVVNEVVALQRMS